MLRFSKKVEYALLALQYMAKREGSVCTVKEMSEQFHISFELLAKVLSALSKKGLAQSLQGVNGGFVIAKKPTLISIADVILAIEGKKAHIVECQHHESSSCYAEDTCTIRYPLERLQSKVDTVFSSMSIADLLPTESQLVHLELA